MTDEEKRAYEWALAHKYDSVSARYAKTLAKYIERFREAGPGAMAAIEERIRQKAVEGWTPDHDAQHSQGELAIVAACYALNKMPAYEEHWDGETGEWWPWHPDWDKREKHSRERSLAIAAALCMAELDRLAELRLRAPSAPPVPQVANNISGE